MLATIVLLLLCSLTALAGIPLILKLVPPNEAFGFRTERTLAHKKAWYRVNKFAGYALVLASLVTVLAVVLGSNTVLRPFWRQLLLFVALIGTGYGATLWYERDLWRRRRSARTQRSTA